MKATDKAVRRIDLAGPKAAVVAMSILLSACNNTDALTPQVDVGSGSSYQSSPVTQAETDRLAGSAYETTNVAPQQPVYAGGGPQNTLQAQAEGLARGQSAASAPLDGPSLPATAQTNPPAQTSQTNHASQAAPVEVAVASAGESGTIRFLPIIGAPLQAVTPLSRELGSQARTHGLTIKSAADTTSEHILKGYFSAFEDGGKVTVVYVWDVLDQNSGRLHRIQGQTSVNGSGGEPWAAVPADVMQQIAQRTMHEYIQWKQGRAG